MDIWQLVQSIKDKPDDEIAKMTKEMLPVALTPQEVKLVRPIFDKASLQWLLFGPPESIKKQLAEILGKTRTKKLFAHFGL